ncbi:MAG: hypothetical protein Q9217_006959, partial [Psora testacea]
APEVMHHIYALEGIAELLVMTKPIAALSLTKYTGANEILAQLKNEDSKVAYLIRITAIILHETSEAIDPLNTSSGPNDISFHINRSDSFLVNFSYDVNSLDLGAFEDLYYAACAKIKDLLHRAEILLDNGFKTHHDDYFGYTHFPLITLGPIKLGDFKACLLTQQRLLLGEQLTTLLNEGIMRKSTRVNRHPFAVISRNDRVTPQYHYLQMATGPVKQNPQGANRNSRYRISQFGLGWEGGSNRLSEVTKMSSGMIFARLAEKHRRTSSESTQDPSIPTSPDGNQGISQVQHIPEYISPYNLDERAKKLRAPGGPEMPCICDPECMCVPLCASDTTQNCLCEENGLFARVTEGMDIDDLDVPDLIRRKRLSWASSNSSSKASTSQTHTERKPPLVEVMTAWESALKPIDDPNVAFDEIRNQQAEQIAPVANDCGHSDVVEVSTNQFDEILSSKDFSPVSTPMKTQYWADFQITPPCNSSLAYREALVRPFSRECATPPKRQSSRFLVARRLFSASSTLKSRVKKVSSVTNPLRGTLTSSGMIVKLGT